jgi:voltage-gated potassium channel
VLVSPVPFLYVTRAYRTCPRQGLQGLLLREARNILRHRGLNWVLLIVLVLNLIAAAMVLEFEGGSQHRQLPGCAVVGGDHDRHGRLWDRFPMSSPGRAVAVVLMIAGIAMFGVITATIAAYFVEQQAQEDLASRLDQIMERLDRIDAGLRPGEDQHALEHLRR